MSIRDIVQDKDKLNKLAKSAFDAIDTDKNNYLERHELEAIMNNVSKDFDFDTPSNEDVDEILREVDQDYSPNEFY